MDLLQAVVAEGFGTIGAQSRHLAVVLADKASEVLRQAGLLSTRLHISI
jgi:hypothetical protein